MKTGIGFDEVLKNILDVRTIGSGDFSLGGADETGMRGMEARRAFMMSDKNRRRAYERDMMEASRLVRKTLSGDPWSRLLFQSAMKGQFREALAISDFPSLFGDIIDRQVLANYKETPYTWNMIAHREEIADFRTARRIRVDYGTGIPQLFTSAQYTATGTQNPNALPMVQIEPGGPYPEDKLADASYTYNLAKYGKRMPFFWETMINDDLNAIKDTPARFGIAMRRAEEYFVTQLFANNTNFFTLANNNVVKSTISNLVSPPVAFSNPNLSHAGLQQAFMVLAAQRDKTGQPISVAGVTLVVGPQQEIPAMNILNALEISINQPDQGGTLTTTGSGATASSYNATRIRAENWMKGKVKLAVNYELPIADTTYAGTGWYLFADPSDRPAIVFGLLRGHTTPELFMKLPNSVAIGEGQMGPGGGGGMGGSSMGNPMEGDFDTDSINYKIRHIFGGTQIDPIMAVYSNGSNI
jgi:hypothetical protein